MEITKFLDEYLGNRSPDSHTAYDSALRRFERFLSLLSISPEDAEPCHIKQFVEWLRCQPNRKTKKAGLCDSSIQTTLAAVRSYYRWLQYYSQSQRNPAAVYRFHQVQDPKEVTPVPPDFADAMCSGSASKRDIAIVQLFRRSGIRLMELIRLNKDSISLVQEMDSSGVPMTYGKASVYGKGRKTRTVLIEQSAVNAVADYLAERGNDSEPALFVANRKKRISKRSVQRIIAAMAMDARAVHVHPHQLRHSFGTEMINAGMKDTVLQKLMGHKSLKTTMRYAKISDETMARQFHAANENCD